MHQKKVPFKGGEKMTGGWLTVLLIGGLLFLMYLNSGCCGGHGKDKNNSGDHKRSSHGHH